jgi:hypothetical protein
MRPLSTWRPKPSEPGSLGEHLDVFSLGAIRYHICTGQAPADNLFELSEKSRTGSELAVSSVLERAGEGLQELIQFQHFPFGDCAVLDGWRFPGTTG